MAQLNGYSSTNREIVAVFNGLNLDGTNTKFYNTDGLANMLAFGEVMMEAVDAYDVILAARMRLENHDNRFVTKDEALELARVAGVARQHLAHLMCRMFGQSGYTTLLCLHDESIHNEGRINNAMVARRDIPSVGDGKGYRLNEHRMTERGDCNDLFDTLPLRCFNMGGRVSGTDWQSERPIRVEWHPKSGGVISEWLPYDVLVVTTLPKNMADDQDLPF